MKTKFNRLSIALALLALSTLNPHLSTIFAQGALTPPGAPAPTMKSLDQIEARTPISSLPYTITNPGSYYVTANLTGISGSDGIDIATNNVALDLNGFTLQGVAGSLNGINILNSSKNLSIHNGALDSWGQNGVNANNAYNSQFDSLCVSSNVDGLFTGPNCLVRICTADQNQNTGIAVGNNCNVKDCATSANGSAGIGLGNSCTVIGCNASGNSNGYGISAGFNVNNCNVINCNASGNSAGIQVGSSSGVQACTASGNGSYGIAVANSSAIRDCVASSNITYGIYVTGNSCQVVGSTCTGNSVNGIYIVGNQTAVKDCTAIGNNNYGIDVGANSTVKDCIASGNGNDGIYIPGSNCQIFGNTCSGNGSYGMYAAGNQNRIDGNTAANNSSYGIGATSINVQNNITRNFAPGNVLGGYYNYTGNNDYAPIQTPTNNPASPWANFQ
jgi:parallel beta-helix repeat protein